MLSPSRISSVYGRVFATLLLTTILMAVMAAPVLADQSKSGKVIGKIVDSETGEALLGVSIYVEGTSQGAISDLDGNYLIKNLAPGQYTLVAKAIGYTTVTITEVIVAGDEQTKMNFSMTEEAVEVEGIEVTAEMVQNSQAAMLKHRQAAKTVTDAISAEQISKSGSGDAAEAMTKVVGATVSEGKYVYVRGLGDRYANTQLNGILMPTSDPNKQAVEMDLIPTSLLDNIVITKTFTPDKPANFSGGSVNLITTDFPESQVISVKTSAGYNSQVTGNENFLKHNEGNQTVPGVWDGTTGDYIGQNWRGYVRYRETDDEASIAAKEDTANAVAALANSFNKNVAQIKNKGPINRAFSASYGNQFQIFGRPLGLNGSFSYNHGYRFYDDGIEAKYKVSTASANQDLFIQHYLHDTKATDEELYGGLANISYSLHTNHKFGFTYVRNKTLENETRFLDGGAPKTFSIDNQDTTTARLQSRVLTYNERELNSLQFNGKHIFNIPLSPQIDWRVSSSEATQLTPDQIFFATKKRVGEYAGDEFVPYDEPIYTIDNTDADILPTRYYRDINEKNKEYAADLSLKLLRDLRMKTGFALVEKDRTHHERRFEYTRTGFYYTDPFDFYFDEYVGSYDTTVTGSTTYLMFNNFVLEKTSPDDQYSGYQDITAYYGMFELALFRRLSIVAGARYEETEMFVENGYEEADADYRSGTINESDLLPSVNLTYALSDKMNLRAAYSKTLARPTIREFAPYGSFDFGASGKQFEGNYNIERTLITNHDLRWEAFVRPGEVVAVSLFHKHFENPIEIAITGADDQTITPVNSDDASLYGVELEVRKRLDNFGSFFKYFVFGGNLAVVDSKVDIPEEELIQQRAYDPNMAETRQMFGQAPYVVNASIGYENPLRGTALTLHFNRVGKKFAVNAPGGTPDVYEKSRSIFDIIASQRLMGSLVLGLNFKNILDTRHEEIYDSEVESAVYRIYGSGRSISASLSLKLD